MRIAALFLFLVATSADDEATIGASAWHEVSTARLVPTMTDTEDRWIYPSIPGDAYLRVVVRSGAEWLDLPFSLSGIPLQTNRR